MEFNHTGILSIAVISVFSDCISIHLCVGHSLYTAPREGYGRLVGVLGRLSKPSLTSLKEEQAKQ